MALADAVPTIVAQEMLRRLRTEVVWGMRANTRWSVEAEVGDEIDIITRPTVSIGDYTVGSTINYGELEAGAKTTIRLNQRKSFAIKLDDVTARQSRPDILGAGAMEAADEMAIVVDDFVRSLFRGVASNSVGALGAAGSEIDLSAALTDANKATVRKLFRSAAAVMTQRHIPMEGRWAILGPIAQYVVTESYEEGELGDVLRTEAATNGMLGRLAGINLYATSNPLGTSGTTEEIAFGNDYACGFVMQMGNTESLRLEQAFADAVRGLAVYGGTIVEPAGVMDATIHYSNGPALS